MSWRDAPVYVEAHDLARWITERALCWDAAARGALGDRLCHAATDLLTSVSLSLTFPDRRADTLRDADEATQELRALMRLARELGLVSPGGQRFVAGRLLIIGRMLGGWRKRVARHPP